MNGRRTILDNGQRAAGNGLMDYVTNRAETINCTVGDASGRERELRTGDPRDSIQRRVRGGGAKLLINGQRAEGNGQRAAANGQRPTGSGQRATGRG